MTVSPTAILIIAPVFCVGRAVVGGLNFNLPPSAPSLRALLRGLQQPSAIGAGKLVLLTSPLHHYCNASIEGGAAAAISHRGQ